MKALFRILLAAVIFWSGCATQAPTPSLKAYNPNQGYYWKLHERTNNSTDLLFLTALSGGGTRAAALSYGVLKELAATPSPNHAGRTMLDEVDGISSVSGGSVTAAAFAEHGNRIFPDLEEQFLKRNVERSLLLQTLNPINWPLLWSGWGGRSDLAAKYYDKILFHQATFDDLPAGSRPFVLINATDVSTGARFEFTQSQFDLICGDVGRFPLSRAVAASSAVPMVLTPVLLVNRAGECGYVQPEWVKKTLAGSKSTPDRALYLARERESFSDRRKRPYLHMVDGGVSDNLGLRAILDSFIATEAGAELSDKRKSARRVVVLFVNAEHHPTHDWDQKVKPPGIFSLGSDSSSIPMTRYSYETVELLRQLLVQWKAIEDERHGGTNWMEFYMIEISFNQIENEQERLYFQNLKTSFHLPPQAVDRLRDVGGKLLRESPEYQRLLRDLNGP